MGVPRHLQVPLSIDTSISYDLDTSLFPGLDDPQYKHEPVLLIASESSHTTVGDKIYRLQDVSHPEQQMDGRSPYRSFGYDIDQLDDLLDIIDVNTHDISCLKDTEAYLTILDDVIERPPQADELQYLEGPPPGSNNVYNNKDSSRICPNSRMAQCCVSLSSGNSTKSGDSMGCCISTENNVSWSIPKVTYSDRTTINRYQSQLFLRDNYPVNMCASNSHCVSNGSFSSFNSNHMLDVNTPVCPKRKRPDNSFGSSSEKRTRYGNGHVANLSQYQNHTYGFHWTRHGNQIRVM